MSADVELGKPLTIEALASVARGGAKVVFDGEARAQVVACREAIETILRMGHQAPAVYGVNTGFGALAETRIGPGDLAKLQLNLLRSHACGIGPDLPDDVVRAMLLLRAQVIAFGHSGVRAEVVELLIELLNRGVCPRVPSQGSVGASGDLAPLAHLALVLVGEGEARLNGEMMRGGEALKRVGLKPVALAAKEGLALINGTQFMTAIGALALLDLRELCRIADVAGAMSLEALLGSEKPFDARLQAMRAHPGQATVAKNLRAILHGSEIISSHVNCSKVQDPYSLRCMPQVHGASRDALGYAWRVIETEMNAVTDNPTVFLDTGTTEIISGGNFHGQPVAFALDFAAIAAAELANISERRVEQLVNPTLSSGLTPFLAQNVGLDSGFMIAQVASASLVSENKVLCHPASVDSIPSSAGREDHVSMGSISARKLRQVVDNVASSLAIEVLVAAQGIDDRVPLMPSQGVVAAHEAVRSVSAVLVEDRPFYEDIAHVRELVMSGAFVQRVENAVGTVA